MAPSAQASFPCMSLALGSGFFTLFTRFLLGFPRGFGRSFGFFLLGRGHIDGKVRAAKRAQLAPGALVGFFGVGSARIILRQDPGRTEGHTDPTLFAPTLV